MSPVSESRGAPQARMRPSGLGRPAARRDGLSKGALTAVAAAVAALHLVGGWALMQVDSVRSAVLEAAPVFVNFIAPPAPPKLEPPPPPPPPPPRLAPKVPPPPAPVMSTPPSPAPAPFVVEPPPPVIEPPAPPVPPPPVEAVAPAPAPAPVAPAPAPKNIPSSAVEYLVKPKLTFPPMSERMGEFGVVTVRLFIDEAGKPSQLTVYKSSGYPRLDREALAAAKNALFKPPTVDGRPVSGYFLMPLEFNKDN